MGEARDLAGERLEEARGEVLIEQHGGERRDGVIVVMKQQRLVHHEQLPFAPAAGEAREEKRGLVFCAREDA